MSGSAPLQFLFYNYAFFSQKDYIISYLHSYIASLLFGKDRLGQTGAISAADVLIRYQLTITLYTVHSIFFGPKYLVRMKVFTRCMEVEGVGVSRRGRVMSLIYV